MSMNTHTHDAGPASTTGFRCDAVGFASTNVLSDGGNIAVSTCNHDADAAEVIGLALCFARQGRLHGGSVPDPVMVRLDALADRGDPACRMVRRWLERRNRDVALAVVSASVAGATAEIISAETGGRADG